MVTRSVRCAVAERETGQVDRGDYTARLGGGGPLGNRESREKPPAGKPSWRQATSASTESKAMLQTAPNAPSWKTCSAPVVKPFETAWLTSRRSPSAACFPCCSAVVATRALNC